MGRVVGQKVLRVDGLEKVSGRAIYGDDIFLPKMLHAAQRYTDIPCGKITKVDISKAEKMAGVEKIILHKDCPGTLRVGPIRQDQYVLVVDRVFYSGDVIAVVAAKTKEQANAAADAIEVEYIPYEGVFDVREAAKEDAKPIHSEYKSNVVVHYPVRKGNVQKGFEQSEKVITREYQTGFHEHGYIEPESIVSEYDPTCSGVKVYGSIQNPFTTRRVVAGFLGLRLNQVNILASNMGGSFGGKDDTVNTLCARAALISLLTEKPVKLTLTRENSIKESYKRHPYLMTYKVGFDLTGKINAMEINILADSGPYSSQSFFVTWRSVVQATGPYEIKNVKTDIKAIYTNNSYTAAFRGFGSPQVIFAQESLMDEIASICNITPLEIRKLNGYKQGSTTASGQKLTRHKVSLSQVIDKAVQGSDYHKKIKEFNKFNSGSTRYKKGIGLACSFRGCALGAEGTDATSAIVSVQADGSVYLWTGLNENGQGMRTTFCQIAAEVLGVELNNVFFLPPQTATITDGGPTVASRATVMGGNAVIQAAKKIKKRIFRAIKDEFTAKDEDDLLWENGTIFSKDRRQSLPFALASTRATLVGENLSAYGWYNAPKVSWEEESGQGDAYFTYVYGCQVAQILLDTYTGKIEVKRMTAAHDVGYAINRLGVEGQIYGGVVQGIGYGVLEHYNIQKGVVKSENIDEYLLPTIKDIGTIDCIIVENPDVDGPFGAKSIGEPSLELGAAAIANSFAFASGTRSYEIPLTLEKSFLGKQLVKPQRASEASLENVKLKKQARRVSDVTLFNPKSFEDALKIRADKEVKLLAGGTDIIIELRAHIGKIVMLNLDAISDLSGIKKVGENIEILANTKLTQICEDPLIREHFPTLVEAAQTIGGLQTRNRGTLVGNIANASPSADSVPPLIAHDVSVVICKVGSCREQKIEDFITGTYRTSLAQDEIIQKVILPIPKKRFLYNYFQLGRRNALNITRLAIVILINFDEDKTIAGIRIASGSMFSTNGRIREIERIFKGNILTEDLINKSVATLEKIVDSKIGGRWSSEYKKPVYLKIYKDAISSFLNRQRMEK